MSRKHEPRIAFTTTQPFWYGVGHLRGNFLCLSTEFDEQGHQTSETWSMRINARQLKDFLNEHLTD